MKNVLHLSVIITLFSLSVFAQELVGERINCAPVVQSTTAELMQH